jgi:hypothetical protein
VRLFIAREAREPHFWIGGPALNPTLPAKVRLKATLNAAWRHAVWYPLLRFAGRRMRCFRDAGRKADTGGYRLARGRVDHVGVSSHS